MYGIQTNILVYVIFPIFLVWEKLPYTFGYIFGNLCQCEMK